MAIRSLVTRGFGNGTFNGTIGGVVLRGYISSTDNTGSKTTTLNDVSLTATGSVDVAGTKTTTLGLTLTASGSVAIVGSKTTTLDTLLLTATGTTAEAITGTYTHTFGAVTLNATGIVRAPGDFVSSPENRVFNVRADDRTISISFDNRKLTRH